MKAHKQGQEVVLISNKDIGSALRKVYEHDVENNAFHLARAAKIVSQKRHVQAEKLIQWFI